MAALPHFSIAHLTVLDLPPPEIVRLAGRLGFNYAGLRLLPTIPGSISYPLMDDPHLMRETLLQMGDSGVGVLDVEIIRIEPQFDPNTFLPLFEVGATLGARAVLVAGLDPDELRLMASYARLCEAARPFGLTIDLEFMPWTRVPDACSALRIVSGAAQPNGGLLLDPLHFSRSKSTLAEVAQIPKEYLHYIQICDAPAEIPKTIEEMIYTARCDRLLPGEGGIDLGGLLSLLPAGMPVSIEVPNLCQIERIGAEAWLRKALAATKATLLAIPPRKRAESDAAAEWLGAPKIQPLC